VVPREPARHDARTTRRFFRVGGAIEDGTDELLRTLPDVPAHWVARAEQAPLILAALESLAGRDGDVRHEDLVAALRAAGLEPDESWQRTLLRLHERRDRLR
jgi:hypothetical protein